MDRLEQQGAQRRRQRERHHPRNDHRDHDGDSELLIHLATEPAQKGHRNEHRGKHQYDGDHRTGYLFHGLEGRLTWRQPFLTHETFDVFDHDDRVVDHDADGEYQTEQGQQVDGKTEQQHAREGSDDGNRNGQQRNQRRARILKEQKHHQHHQHDGFDEGVDHLLDRYAHELGGVEGYLVGQAIGKPL